ncbi:MAG TPA: FAD-binding oxidoreductase [Blastocatellia bacterium]|nr:FAD-binding oxidoreductase [Blastocatellia bacterium]
MKKVAEVVIIGGGCMGASAAYHLARRGVTDVLLVEREPMLAMGSTGRNAGGVRHQYSTEINIRMSIESIKLFENFKEVVGYEIDFHQDGYLFLLSTEENVRSFKANIELQRRLGVEVEFLAPEEARRLAPGLDTEGVLGASYCARDGIADPNGVTMGFAKAAQSAGVEIWRETEVTGIKTEAGRISSVETSRGAISTRTVINAAGPYAQTIGRMVGLEIPVLPLRRHIFITEPIIARRKDTNGLAVPESRIMVIDFETSFYFHREGAGILFGMSDPDEIPGFDTSVSWEFLEKVSRVAISRLPALAEAGIAHAWAGLYEVTPDAMPIIGPARDVRGFYMINGFSGHGFQHSPAAGRILVEIMLDGSPSDVDPGPFSFDRFYEGGTNAEMYVV